MRLTWLGHSCFVVEEDGYRIAIDPYRDGMIPGLSPLRVSAHEVLCSHTHDDHGYAQAVQIIEKTKESPFLITRVQSAHDDCGGERRGMNTIHVLEANGVRVAHLGDLGTALTNNQRDAIGRLDALLVPIGGFYTIDAAEAKQAADFLSPNVVIPMHFRTNTYGFEVLINTCDDFLALFDDVAVYPTSTIDITPETRKQTASLLYIPGDAGKA